MLRSELKDELPVPLPGIATTAGGGGDLAPHAATDEGRAECRRLSLPLHQYAHTLLSQPHDVLHLPFAASTPEEFLQEAGKSRTLTGQPVTVGGRAHAAVFWLKHDFGPDAGVLGAECCVDSSAVRHTIQFLREPVTVHPGRDTVLRTTTRFCATGAIQIDASVETR